MADFEVTGTVTLDAEGMIASVDELLDKLDEFQNKVSEIDAELQALEDHEIKLDIIIENQDKLDELKLFLMEIEDHVYEIKFAVNDDDAKAKIDDMKLKIDDLTMKDHDVKITVNDGDIADAAAKIELLKKEVDSLDKAEKDAKDSGSGFEFSMLMLAPAAIPAAGAVLSLVGAVGGLASALLTTVIPVAAFGLSMKSAYTAITTFAGTLSTSVTTALANAGGDFTTINNILDNNSAAFRKLNPVVQDAIINYYIMKDAVGQFQSAIKPEVYSALTQAFGIISNLLVMLIPAAKNAGEAIDTFLTNFNIRINDPTFQKFFSDMAKNIGTLVTDFGTGFTNIIEGIVALADAFMPLGVSMAGGFAKMTAEFDKWAQHLGQSKGFHQFLNVVETDGPLILKIVGNIIELIGHLFIAIGESKVNTKIFTDILNFFQKINSFTGSHQQFTQLAGDLGLVGIAAVKLGPALGPLMEFIATPVGAVVAAIVGIGAAFMYAYTHSASFRNWVQTNLLPMFKGLIQQVKQMGQFFVSIWPEIEQIWKKYGSNIMSIIMVDLRTIVSVVEDAMKVIKGIIDIVLGLLSGNWKQVWKGVEEVFSGVVHGILALANGLFNELENVFKMMWKFISGLFSSALSGIEHNFDTNMRTIEGWVSSAYHTVINTVQSWMADFASWVGRGLANVGTFFSNFPGDVLRWLGNLGSLLINAGEQLIQGFINGIENMFGSVQSTLSSLTNWLTSWKGPPEKDKTLLTSSGQLVIQGFIDGMESKYSAVHNSLSGLTNSLGTNMSKQLTTNLAARINTSLNNAGAGTGAITASGSTTSGGGGSQPTQVVFASGAIQITNPSQENPGTSLTRTMQAISKFGTIQMPSGMRAG